MKLYEVKCEQEPGSAGAKKQGKSYKHVGYAGSMAEVRDIKENMIALYGVNKKEIEVGEVEVDTGKQGLLAFVNSVTAEFINGDVVEPDTND